MFTRATIARGISAGRVSMELAALAGGLYVLLSIVTPLIEPQFDFWRSHLEDYAAGGYGALVNVSYAAMAIALGSLSGGLVSKGGWRALALALLLPPAVLCVALTVDPIGVARQATVTSLAILGLAVGPVAVSIVYRRSFGRARATVMGLGVLVAIAFIALAAGPESVGGAVNRVFDVAAGAWIVFAAVPRLRAD